MDLNYDLIGIQIQKHREQKGLSQADLGDIIDSTERHVRRIEGGHCGVSLNLFVAIANALNASADDLLDSMIDFNVHFPLFYAVFATFSPFINKRLLMPIPSR